ncbi:MAG: hypothetical protein CFE44_01695 [Burkholderiales bacterium PBB4]|nr:MAG: hypothetical protein CFE44_01695 [Burkholderiales bacterium PBB4]
MTDKTWQVADVGASDVPDVRLLFEAVFGHAMSDSLWNWKYGDGRGVGVAARAPDGELLAHYGGTYRELRYGAFAHHGIHIGDVMVAAAGRAALSHKGPFGLVTEEFFRCHVGSTKGKGVGFGFPNDRHMRLGERLGHYVRVESIFELQWPAVSSRDFEAVPIDWSDLSTEARINELCESLMASFLEHVIPLRSFSWLKHRFANHPEYQYQAFWIKELGSRRLLGAIFLRTLPTGCLPDGQACWELMDWIGSPVNSTMLVEAARHVVFERSGHALRLWCSGLVADQVYLSEGSKNRVCFAAMTIPNPFSETPRWWLTGGDTDFR